MNLYQTSTLLKYINLVINIKNVFNEAQTLFLDVDHEVKCLRKWIKNMENCIQPLNFKLKWTKAELETKGIEHTVSFLYLYTLFMILLR